MTASDREGFNILVVCTGNVCRSPQAAQLLQAEAEAEQAGEPWRSTVRITSAGTRALVGSPMDEPAAALSSKFGAAATEHTARQLDTAMIEDADLVLCMAREHRSAVVRSVPRASRRTFLLTEFVDLLEGLGEPSDRQSESLQSESLQPGGVPAELADRLRRGVERVAAQRGMIPPRDPETVDVVDPYQRSPKIYRESAEQVRAAIAGIHRSLHTLTRGVAR